MFRLIFTRLVAFVLTILAASVILFVTKVLPGSAAKAALGIDATPQAIARFDAQHGLDRPLVVQYMEIGCSARFAAISASASRTALPSDRNSQAASP